MHGTPSRGDRRALGDAGQHLGDVAHLHGRAFAREFAGDVHQAAEIAAQHHLRAGLRPAPPS